MSKLLTNNIKINFLHKNLLKYTQRNHTWHLNPDFISQNPTELEALPILHWVDGKGDRQMYPPRK